MPKMLKELEAAPAEVGFLGHNGLGKNIVQYWRSFDHLERYARDRDALHWPAWVEFNRRMKESRGDVGIWHETYRIRAGEYEAIYSGMPPYGIGKAGAQRAVTGEIDSARQRIGVAYSFVISSPRRPRPPSLDRIRRIVKPRRRGMPARH